MAARKPRNTIFFAHDPSPRAKRIFDGRVPTGSYRVLWDGRKVNPSGMHYIGTMARTGKHWAGTLIPMSHLKPLAERLVDEGLVTGRSGKDAMTDLATVTDKLIPTRIMRMGGEFAELATRYPEHFTPLAALKVGTGRCSDWAAVYTGLARNIPVLGDTAIAGHPEFMSVRDFLGARGLTGMRLDQRVLKGMHRWHVWPVVRLGEGRHPVITRQLIEGLDRARSDADHEKVEAKIRAGRFPVYKEYEPRSLLRVPSGLVPDVDGLVERARG